MTIVCIPTGPAVVTAVKSRAGANAVRLHVYSFNNCSSLACYDGSMKAGGQVRPDAHR